MATTSDLPAGDVNSYDYLIVGGGTAGCVIASRLAEYLPNKRILLVEAGPSDFMDDRVLLLKEWLSLLGGELDYDYTTTEQPMGMSTCSLSRALCILQSPCSNQLHRQVTAISITPGPRCWVVAPVTTLSSPSAPSNMTAVFGRRRVARAGLSRP